MSTSVKTTISMKEELFKEVKRLAGELNVSKSKLFVMAVQDYIKKNESQNLLSQINVAFSVYPDSDEIKVHEKMHQKQTKNFEKESW